MYGLLILSERIHYYRFEHPPPSPHFIVLSICSFELCQIILKWIGLMKGKEATKKTSHFTVRLKNEEWRMKWKYLFSRRLHLTLFSEILLIRNGSRRKHSLFQICAIRSKVQLNECKTEKKIVDEKCVAIAFEWMPLKTWWELNKKRKTNFNFELETTTQNIIKHSDQPK